MKLIRKKLFVSTQILEILLNFLRTLNVNLNISNFIFINITSKIQLQRGK